MALPIIGPLISLITTGISSYAEHKRLQQEGKNEAQRAKNERLRDRQLSEDDWDALMAEGSQDSWKDEYWTIVLSIPAILAFIPGAVPYVEAGFTVLEGMPDWYKIALGVAIAAAFGIKKVHQLMVTKN